MEPTDRSERKRRGAWYTPPALVDFLIGQTVLPALADPVTHPTQPGQAEPLRVLDPACGDGRLLAAALKAAQQAGEAAPHGVHRTLPDAPLAARSALVSEKAALGAEVADTGVEGRQPLVLAAARLPAGPPAATTPRRAASTNTSGGRDRAPAALVSEETALGAVFADTSVGRAGWDDAPRVELVGIELDAATAAEAHRAVPEATILTGDGRALDPGGLFDVVVGNPPYLGQLARSTSRGGRSRLGGGPYADVAAEFLVRSLQLARPDGGRVALVLPQSFLATRDTAAIRAAAIECGAVIGFWWASARVFAAGVNVAILVVQRGREQSPVPRWQGPDFQRLPDAPASTVRGSTWAPLIADLAGLPPVELSEDHGRLADLAWATAGFRQHFYGLIPFVDDAEEGAPLVTSGLIDAGRCAWGARPARFAKRSFEAPRVDLTRLGLVDARLAAWVRRQLAPKVLVAAQTRVIEAVVDHDGAWIPSVPVVAVHPRRVADLWAVGAVLLAPPVAAWAAARYVGVGLGPTSLKLSAAQVLDLPLPGRPWDEAAALLRAGDVDGCAVRMCAVYGLEASAVETLLTWWRAGAGLADGAPVATARSRNGCPG